MYVFRRPIIYLDYEKKVHNKERNKIELPTLEEEFKLNFGNTLKIDKINNLPNLCNELLKTENISEINIDNFFKRYLSNIGFSSLNAAKYLKEKSTLS